jgi:hypothetical protein
MKGLKLYIRDPKFVGVSCIHTTPRGVHIRFYSSKDTVLQIPADAAGCRPTPQLLPRDSLLGIRKVFYVWRSAPHPQKRPVDNGQSACYPRTCVPTFGSYRREHCCRNLSATWWFDCSSTAIFLQPFYHACLKTHVSLFWGRRLRFQHDGAPEHYGYTQLWSKATCSVVSCKRRPWFNRLTYCAI